MMRAFRITPILSREATTENPGAGWKASKGNSGKRSRALPVMKRLKAEIRARSLNFNFEL
jgi:hypothetical protein